MGDNFYLVLLLRGSDCLPLRNSTVASAMYAAMKKLPLLLAGLSLTLACQDATRRQQQGRQYVFDEARLLTNGQKQQLHGQLERYEAENGLQCVLYAVPSLGLQTIDDLSKDKAAELPAGQHGINNVAIIYVARDERQVKIDIGRGLEWQVPDSVSAAILAGMIPLLREDRYYEALQQGFEQIYRLSRGVSWQVAYPSTQAALAAGDSALGRIVRFKGRGLPRTFDFMAVNAQFDERFFVLVQSDEGDTVGVAFTYYQLDPVEHSLRSGEADDWYARIVFSDPLEVQLLGIE
ncbi:MAG: hypothetical protein OHK0039_42570 [Bacteroidia bacterium]